VRRGLPEAAFVRALALGMASAALLLAAVRPAAAQDARVEVDPAPYYQGQPIALQIVATQFEEEPAPEVEFDPSEGLSLRFLGVSPSTSTSITIINGQMSRVHEVSFVYRYELSSARVGRVEVPEFRVRQGATLRRTRPFALEIAAVPTSEEFGIAVVLPPGPIFVGQKVPVEIELRIDEAVLQDYLNYRVQVPLFDTPGLRFLDTSPVRSNTQLEITTATGVIRLPAVSEERNIGGRSNLVLRAERTLVAQKPGLIRADAPTVTIERGTGFRRDFFGQRQATGARRSVSAGRAIRLEVAEVPAAGRPASFAGAVGSGFSLEVEADRSVVQLGEPIALTFHLRGQGDLSTAGLPPLSADGLFDPALFRLPEEAPAGLIDEDGKHFEVTLRVLDAGVREIPALAYSWFDAETRRFETVHSEPIALAVGAAQVVGAESVASRAGDESDGGGERIFSGGGLGRGGGQSRCGRGLGHRRGGGGTAIFARGERGEPRSRARSGDPAPRGPSRAGHGLRDALSLRRRSRAARLRSPRSSPAWSRSAGTRADGGARRREGRDRGGGRAWSGGWCRGPRSGAPGARRGLSRRVDGLARCAPRGV
jgi:hypothetical protein